MKNKVVAATFLCIGLAFSLQAQTINLPPVISWQKSLGGSGDDMANCVKPLSDSGFIIAGTSNSNNGDITGNHGQDDFCLIKLNNAGNLIWQHSYGGTSLDQAISVVRTFDGGFAVAGKSSSNNGDVTGNHGSSDYWLIKTDDQGTLQWQKSYGGSQSDVANSMESTSDSGFVMAGTSYSNDGDVSGNHSRGDAWVIKVDRNGNLQWQKTIGGSKLDIANDIEQACDSGYIVTGYSLSNDGDMAINRGQEDFMFFKLDANGNLQWLKTMGGTGGDCGSSGIQTIDGGYAICGLTHSGNYDVTDHIKDHDVWIIKTDSLGITQWTHCLGGTGGDNGVDIKQQADGTLVAGSYTVSNDHDITTNHGGRDIWLTALNTSGNLLWQKTFGGSYDDSPGNVEIISTGQYIVAGKTNSNDGDVTGNNGNSDGWIVKLSVPDNNIFYADADGDGYGDPNSVIDTSSQPLGYVIDNNDCNDSNAAVHPGAEEISNSIDDNCNGATDENLYATVTPGGTVSVCSGVVVTLTANSGSGITYQWKKGSTNIAGATNQTYSTSTPAKYKVTEANNFGYTSTSAVTTITNAANATATITPLTGLDLCNSDSVVLQANSGTGLIYQWLKGTTIIANATNQTYRATSKGTYKVLVTNSNGCSKTSAGTKVTQSCKDGSYIYGTSGDEFSIYPNPNNGQFFIDLKAHTGNDGTATIEILSNIGQLIYTEKARVVNGLLNEEVKLNITLPEGIYFVRVVMDKEMFNGQFVYQK
ncbi:MAG TPA: MopE-related protein [Chitinophagales bacterium]|nr:MopE-related protein [Chitinophagales bacterium]